MTNFEKLSEEKKYDKCLNYALMQCQSFMFNPLYDQPELKGYREEVKSIINWIANKQGLDNLKLY